jgi:hypothetical protein
MFKEPVYMPDGDAVIVPHSKVAFDATGGGNREKGLNFKASVGRTGKNNDAVFSKFMSLHEGDKYVEEGRRALQARAEKTKENIVDKPFKMSSPMKSSACPGDYIGTLGGKIAHQPETVHVAKKKGEIPEQPKGIYTSVPKKGSFGYNKTTLSERQGYKGVATEYEYHHDPDDLHKQRRMDALEAHHKACVSDRPFRPSHPSKKGTYGMINTTISKGKGVAGEYEYLISSVPPGSGSGIAGEDGGGAGKKPELTPFVPSNAHVAKRINHIPYLHDPLDPKIQKEHDAKIAESKRIAATGNWRPNMSYKTDMIRSVVKMNIPRVQ